MKKKEGGWEAMAVRIILDRKVKKGKEQFAKLLRELRSKAMPSKGYISGETFRASKDLTITSYHDVAERNGLGALEKDPARKTIQTKIAKLMSRPTKTKMYVYA
jgi:hypothetical protein